MNSEKLFRESLLFLSKRTDILEKMQAEISEAVPVKDMQHKYGLFADYNGKKCYCAIRPVASLLFPAMSFELAYRDEAGREQGGNFMTAPANSYLLMWMGLAGQNVSEDMNYKKNEKHFEHNDCDKAAVMFIRKTPLKRKLKYELEKYTDLSLQQIIEEINKYIDIELQKEKPKKHLYFDFSHKRLKISRSRETKTMSQSGFKFVASLEREGCPITVVFDRDILKQFCNKQWLYLDENMHYIDRLQSAPAINTVLVRAIDDETKRLYFEELTMPEYLFYHMRLRESDGEYYNTDEELENYISIYRSISGNSGKRDNERDGLVEEVIKIPQNSIKKMYELGIGVRGRDYLNCGMCRKDYERIREYGQMAGTYGLTGHKGPYNLYEYDIVDYLKWRNYNRKALDVQIIKN